MAQVWIRECQECGHKQGDNPPDPNRELSAAYANRECKRCKSPALDYGSHERA